MALRSAYFGRWKGSPTVLLWGDAAGMRELRDFLRNPRNVASGLTLEQFCVAVDNRTIAVRAVSQRRDTGMRLAHNGLEWRLRPDLADEFAEKVDQLVSSTAGHQYLDAYGGNIVVEVSTGEYPENLHPEHKPTAVR